MLLALTVAQVSTNGTKGFVARGWFRDKDENTTCQDGYRKKPKTHPRNLEDTEAKADIVQADPSYNGSPLRKTKRSRLSLTT